MLIFRFNRISGRFEITGVSGATSHPLGSFRPPVDISYSGKTFIVRMDLPGASPEDILIEAGEQEITISGKIMSPDTSGPCRLMERPTGSFMRTISFPGKIVADKVTSQLQYGVLTIEIPAPDLDRDSTRIEIRIKGAD
jgi:HSP20 family protein